MRVSVLVVPAIAALLGGSSHARACSPGQPTAPTALPRTGATGVSTATSIVVLSPNEPFGLSLLAGGQEVPLAGWTALGSGADEALGATNFWELRIGAAGSMLVGSTEYVLSLPGGDAGGTALTDFTTAAGYDKAAGTAPNLRGFQLWRVRYPVADIASGNCVFAEYQGFITIDYDPATVPNTPASSVVHTFHLAPMTGGAAQTFVYTGSNAFTGLAPSGAYPIPLGQWQPDLDPTRQYCLSISASGDGDLARPMLSSNQVCADVTQLSATGAPPAPGLTGAAAGGGGGGCSAAGAPNLHWPLSLAATILIGLSLATRRARRRR